MDLRRRPQQVLSRCSFVERWGKPSYDDRNIFDAALDGNAEAHHAPVVREDGGEAQGRNLREKMEKPKGNPREKVEKPKGTSKWRRRTCPGFGGIEFRQRI